MRHRWKFQYVVTISICDNAIARAFDLHRDTYQRISLGINRKRLRVYTIVDFSFIRTFAPSF